MQAFKRLFSNYFYIIYTLALSYTTKVVQFFHTSKHFCNYFLTKCKKKGTALSYNPPSQTKQYINTLYHTLYISYMFLQDI